HRLSFPTGMLDEKPRPGTTPSAIVGFTRRRSLRAGTAYCVNPVSVLRLFAENSRRKSPLRIGTQIGWRPTRWAGAKFIFIAHEPMKQSNLYRQHRRIYWPGR